MPTESPEFASIAAVRAYIARAFALPPVPRTVGGVRLHEAQRNAAARVRDIAGHFGGALLADPTGSGKTFAALAAVHDAERLVVVVPAILRERWRAALAQAAMAAAVISMESLARGRTVPMSADWIIVDEAHHFRNPHTRRYAALAALCRRSRVVLVTATPVHNRLDDARAQVALFRGDAARELTADDIGAMTVREGAPPALPALDGPHVVSVDACDEPLLDSLLALPPPLRAADAGEAGDAGALVTYTLVRRWASSRAALAATLRRRLATGEALLAAAHAGRAPTRSELSAWTFDGESIQLAFAELLVDADAATRSGPSAPDIERHLRGIRELLDRLRGGPDVDDRRAAALIGLRARHPHERIVAFTCHADTAIELARRLRRERGVALLTGDRVASAAGRFSRAEVLGQLADPGRQTPEARRIDLLIATDVLSEGIDMLAVSVVVHLDLPWNPAVLDQRVGRARRFGAPHDRVSVYALAPPASAARLLDIEDRLARKLAAAAALVGSASRVVPSFGAVASSAITRTSAADVESRIAAVLRRWVASDGTAASPGHHGADRPLVAACHAESAGWLALVHDGARLRLAAYDPESPSATLDRRAVLRALQTATSEVATPNQRQANAVLTDLARWLERRHAGSVASIDAPHSATRARIVRRTTSALAHATPAARVRLAPLAAAARAVARARWSAGDERALAPLAADGAMPTEPWLRAVAAFGARDPAIDRQRPRVLALIIMGAQHDPRGSARPALQPDSHVARIQGVPDQAEHAGPRHRRRHRHGDQPPGAGDRR